MSTTVGSTLVIPIGPGIAGQKLHTVRRGETVESIAKKYGITAEEIIKANPRIQDNPDGLAIGMTLAIPRTGARARDVKQDARDLQREAGRQGKGFVSQFDSEKTFPSPVVKRDEPAQPTSTPVDTTSLYDGA